MSRTADRAESNIADAHVPLTTLAAYGLPSLGTGAMFGLLLGYFLKFATDVLLIAPGIVGVVLLASRFWYAISDPLAGYWSDRTRTRIGRRRPWILAAALPLPLAFVALWSPPTSIQGAALTAWTACWMLLFFAGSTAFGVPHKALGAELGAGYHGRTRVFATSAMAGFVGALFSAGTIFLLERAADPRATASRTTLVFAVLTAAFLVFAGTRLRENPSHEGRGSQRGLRAFVDVWRNRHARPLLALHFLSDLGGASFAGLLPFVSDYVLKTHGKAGVYLLAVLVGVLLGIPCWVSLSRRFGKTRVWLRATLLQIPLCLVFFLIPEGGWLYLAGGMVLIGMLTACNMVAAPSVQADIIDVDALHTGERKEGVYFASWNLVQKTAIGLNLGLVGLWLQLSGFVPNVEQTPQAKLTIGLAFAGLPATCMCLMVAILMRARLDDRIRAALRAQ
jgi:GPH family glycoside/pentoside/hexuronide:cation symporter